MGVAAGLAAFGAVTSFMGAKAQADAADKQAAAAESSAALQAQIQREQLDFAKEQFYWWQDLYEEDRQRWFDIYGPIEENVASFFRKLTPEQFTVPAIQTLNKQYSTLVEQLNRKVGQGQLTQGAAEQLKAEGAINTAEAAAAIRARAPLEVAQAKMGIVKPQVAAQSNPLTSAVMNAYTNQAATQQGLMNTYLNLANQNNAAAMQGYQAAAGAVMGGIQQYIAQQQQQQLLNQLQTGQMYGINPFGQQAAMLAQQNQGLF